MEKKLVAGEIFLPVYEQSLQGRDMVTDIVNNNFITLDLEVVIFRNILVVEHI